MIEFFQGWRRKVGTLVLVLACLVTSAWVRSLTVADILTIPTGKASAITLSTTGNRLCIRTGYDHEEFYELNWDARLVSSWRPGTTPVAGASSEECESEALRPYMFPIDPYSFEPVDWTVRRLGFGFGVSPPIARQIFRLQYLLVPFWAIVFPLTLISAFLLFSVPRIARGGTNESNGPFTKWRGYCNGLLKRLAGGADFTRITPS